MKVLVTGATGFTGSYTVPQLLECGHEVIGFARPTSNRSILDDYDIEWRYGDVKDSDSLAQALSDVDAIVNIVSLGFGDAPSIVSAIQKSGVQRAVVISTTALFTQLNASSKGVRIAAEQTIEQSGLDYTILRPTMIYGSSRDRNMCRLIRFIQKSPLIPIFGKGENLQQPIYVGDVAEAITSCLNVEQTHRKSYNIAGAKPLTYNQVIDAISELMGKQVVKLHLPAGLAMALLRTIEKTPLRLPIKAEQIQRLNEDKAFSYNEAVRDFDFSPRTFEEGIQIELTEMYIEPNSARAWTG